MTPIIQVLCSRGGVGKSLVSMSVLHILQKRKKNPFLIESDNSNPDVALSYRDELDLETIDLSQRAGWALMGNCLDGYRHRNVVLNGRAGSRDAVRTYSRNFWRIVQKLERPVTTLWPLNRNLDPVLQLAEYVALAPTDAQHTVYVIRNLFYSEDGRFPAYDGSEVRKAIEAGGGRTIDFPIMAERNAEYLYDKRWTIADVVERADLGDRIDMEYWVQDMTEVLGPLIDA